MITFVRNITQLKVKKGDSIIPTGIYGNKIHFRINKNNKDAHRCYGIQSDIDSMILDMFGITEHEFIKLSK